MNPIQSNPSPLIVNNHVTPYALKALKNFGGVFDAVAAQPRNFRQGEGGTCLQNARNQLRNLCNQFLDEDNGILPNNPVYQKAKECLSVLKRQTATGPINLTEADVLNLTTSVIGSYNAFAEYIAQTSGNPNQNLISQNVYANAQELKDLITSYNSQQTPIEYQGAHAAIYNANFQDIGTIFTTHIANNPQLLNLGLKNTLAELHQEILIDATGIHELEYARPLDYVVLKHALQYVSLNRRSDHATHVNSVLTTATQLYHSTSDKDIATKIIEVMAGNVKYQMTDEHLASCIYILCAKVTQIHQKLSILHGILMHQSFYYFSNCAKINFAHAFNDLARLSKNYTYSDNNFSLYTLNFLERVYVFSNANQQEPLSQQEFSQLQIRIQNYQQNHDIKFRYDQVMQNILNTHVQEIQQNEHILNLRNQAAHSNVTEVELIPIIRDLIHEIAKVYFPLA